MQSAFFITYVLSKLISLLPLTTEGSEMIDVLPGIGKDELTIILDTLALILGLCF